MLIIWIYNSVHCFKDLKGFYLCLHQTVQAHSILVQDSHQVKGMNEYTLMGGYKITQYDCIYTYFCA